MKLKVLALSLVLTVSLLVGCTPKEEAPAANDTDVVTSASMVTDEASLLEAISKDGSWIILFSEDFTTDQELVVEGEFTNRDVAARKIALYEQDADRNKTAVFTLTAPKLTIKSENARIQGGTFVGDVYVEANGFKVVDAIVEGNVYFANEEVMASFALENEGTVTGVMEVKADADVVSSASMVTDEDSLLKAISEDGTWIILFSEDFTTDQELVVEGEFTNRDVAARKIALYEQDADRNKTAVFTLTAPKLTIKSENARIQGGTFVGDVYVEANGFKIVDAKVEGNVYFANEEVMASFALENEGTVTGVTEVK